MQMKADQVLLAVIIGTVINVVGFTFNVILVNQAIYITQTRMDKFERQIIDLSIQLKTQAKRLADLEKKR